MSLWVGHLDGILTRKWTIHTYSYKHTYYRVAFEHKLAKMYTTKWGLRNSTYLVWWIVCWTVDAHWRSKSIEFSSSPFFSVSKRYFYLFVIYFTFSRPSIYSYFMCIKSKRKPWKWIWHASLCLPNKQACTHLTPSPTPTTLKVIGVFVHFKLLIRSKCTVL